MNVIASSVRLALASLPAILLSSTVTAADAPAVTAIKAAHMVDVRKGTVIDDAVVLVSGERITAAGSKLAVPAGATVIDLGNKTLLPGLIDSHTHLTGDPQDAGYAIVAKSIPRSTLTGAKNARLTLQAGFTTVRDVGADGYADIGLRDAINDGDVPGPRIAASGPAMSITGGHCDDNMHAPEYQRSALGVADGTDEAQKIARRNIKYGGEGIKLSVLAGVDSIEHGSYIDDEGIKLMKEHKTWLVPTVYLGDWLVENAEAIKLPKPLLEKAKVVLPQARVNIGRAIKAGVPVAFGTDAAVYPHGLNAREFAVLVKLGMTPAQAIRTATVNASELLGWSDRIGTIEAGKFADMIAVDGEPLKDVTVLERVQWVMKGGAVVR